ncbi:PepSY-associated TM helix domain-containing protein [Sphingomonas sp. HF-S4]|uniref:PepSY-associated TM helix domain-containing protein n=1 Tax=Sphingomonas agrestis TaxID=3080540 RepID=A0ABU3Y395_9SPHN|nr:PepSY-associated TM helix domain-containing protein [Sphingomonas sp. HF-S4]MDV3455839.1 PepSY-associated TM helix domain-containing protein [Sphingomonas sp. HF-S4]
MRLLSLFHRWVGGISGALLALLGLTGALLVWRDALTFVPHANGPVVPDAAALERVVATLAHSAQPIDRVTFAGDGFGLHQVVYANGSGAYLSQGGEVVTLWTSAWQRPELWLFDLHHRLLLGDVGETVNGIVGLIGLFFVVSGVILWWRMRARFRPRLWPAKMTPGAIVHHHRDLGIVTAPLLLLSLLTGVMMALPAIGQFVLSPLGENPRLRPPKVPVDHALATPALVPGVLRSAQDRFPGAEPRRLQWPKRPGTPITLRLRQSFEWTPNGRTFLYFDPATMTVIGAVDATTAGSHASAREKLYPLHAAKVGGLAWKVAMTLSGLALAMLGSLAVYGFWKTRSNMRASARRKRVAAAKV